MATIKGLREAMKRIRSLGDERMVAAVNMGLYAAADHIKVRAQISITEGSTSGAGHVPSPAGSPPNNDTGVLANSIEAVLVGPLKAEVSANAPYAVIQEFGSSKTPERPFMAPAAINSRSEVGAIVAAAVRAAVRSGRR